MEHNGGGTTVMELDGVPSKFCQRNVRALPIPLAVSPQARERQGGLPRGQQGRP